MVNFLTIAFLCILPLGEILRIQMNNGISIQLLDVITCVIFLYSIFHLKKLRTLLAIPFIKQILLFLGVCVVSLFINSFRFPFHEIGIGSLYLIRWVIYVSIYIFFFQTVRKRLRQVSYWILISGISVSLLGILQYFLYPNLGNLFYAGWDTHDLRLFATFYDPNFAGIYLVLNFLFALDLFFKKIVQKKSKQIWLFGGMLLLFCCTILLTYSRSAFLALGIGLSLYLFPKGYKKFLPVFGAVLILFILFVIFLTGVPSEGAHLLRIPSSKARIDSVTHAFTIFTDDPLFGIGFDMYRYAQEAHHFLGQPTWEVSHSAAGTDTSLLFILVTTGIIGFIVFCYLQWNIISLLLKQNFSGSSLGIAMLGALFMSSFFINALFYPPIMAFIWMMLGIIVNT